MIRLSRLTPRDLDALSAYADGALAPAERQAVETRLAQDPVLRQALKEIRATSALLRALPQVRPPRSFALTPDMAAMRPGWLRYPGLQLATAVATLAFMVTVGVDLFGGAASSAAFRAAAPAEEMLMEAPAVQSVLPTQVGADALEAGAPPAGTATATMPASESAKLEAPGVGGGGELPPAAQDAVTAVPLLEAGPAASGECEACGGEMELPPAAPQEKIADAPTPEAPPVGQDAAAQAMTASAEEPAPETREPRGLPPVRWLEIGLAGVALTLAAVTLRARRRAR